MIVDKMSFIRYGLLVLSLTNQVLVAFGKSPLPIDNAQLEMILSLVFTVVMGLYAGYRNNYLTKDSGGLQKKALQAQGLYKK